MKRWIIGIVAAVLAIGGVAFWLSQQKISLPGLDGRTRKVERRTLTIPIRATGLIEPAVPLIEIKSKASGEVARIYVKAGDIVRADQLLLELDPKDEQRNVERAEAEMNRAKATLEKAKVALQQQKDDHPVNVEAAAAAVASAAAALEQLQYQLDEQEKLLPSGGTSEKVVRNHRHMRDQGAAQVKQASAELQRVKNARALIDLAEQDVALADATFASARKTWEDAKERLVETKRYSPIDGMVSKINVRVGELIMSGTTSLTGGTVLMTLADMSDLYVTAQVDEADISSVLELAPAPARPGMQRVEAVLQENLSASAAQSDVPAPAMVQALASAPASGPASRPSVALPGGVAAGKPVKISVEAFREEEFQGVIEHVSPEPLRQSSVVTYDVRIRLTSPNRYKLLLGMQADAEFTSESVDALVVPIDAVKVRDGDTGAQAERGVWIPVDGPERKKWQPCRLGLDDGAYVEVVEGLREGQEVYTQLPVDLNRNQ